MECMSPKNDNARVPTPQEPDIMVFTDGSKDIQKQKTGAGSAFYTNGKPIHVGGRDLIFSYKLQEKNTVFQTEMWAVKKACEILLENMENDPPLGQIC